MVWVDVVVWFGWMWWCSLGGCGGVVWMEVVVFGDDQVGVGDKLVLLLLREEGIPDREERTAPPPKLLQMHPHQDAAGGRVHDG